MKKYYSSTVNKFGLGSSTGYATYFSGCNTMRWKSSVLSDPDGYLSMDAAEILADLFGEVYWWQTQKRVAREKQWRAAAKESFFCSGIFV